MHGSRGYSGDGVVEILYLNCVCVVGGVDRFEIVAFIFWLVTGWVV